MLGRGEVRRRERFREGGEVRGPWASELARTGWLAERWAWEGLGGREVCGADGVGVCRDRKDFEQINLLRFRYK